MNESNEKQDKRHTPPSGWKGTKQPKGSYTAAWKGKLKNAILNQSEYEALVEFLEYKRAKFEEEYLTDANLMEKAIEASVLYKKGNFYTWLANESRKPYLHHRNGCNNAWYFHNDAELIRRTAQQISTNRGLAHSCRHFGWKTRYARQIQEYEHEQHNRWCSQYHIRNVCRSRKIPSYPETQSWVLDYGTQSRYTIEEINNTLGEYVEYVLKISSSDGTPINVRFRYKIPDRIHLRGVSIISVRKPLLFKDAGSGEWMFSLPYWFYPRSEDLSRKGHLGVDIGFVRLFRASVVYPDGSYIENLDPSVETERQHNRIQQMLAEKKACFAKAAAKRRLAANCPDYLQRMRLEAAAANLARNVEELRSAISDARVGVEWLAANDIVSFACEFSCDEIHIEDLRFVEFGGQYWDFSSFFTKLKEVANRVGIRVVRVNAYKTSKTDPSTGLLYAEDDAPGLGEDRYCRWGDGSVHCRDGSAALEIACRPKRGGEGDTRHERVLKRGVRPARRCRSYGKGKRASWRRDREHRCVCEGTRPSSVFLRSLSVLRGEWLEVIEAKKKRDGLSGVGAFGSVASLVRFTSVGVGVSQPSGERALFSRVEGTQSLDNRVLCHEAILAGIQSKHRKI